MGDFCVSISRLKAEHERRIALIRRPDTTEGYFYNHSVFDEFGELLFNKAGYTTRSVFQRKSEIIRTFGIPKTRWLTTKVKRVKNIREKDEELRARLSRYAIRMQKADGSSSTESYDKYATHIIHDVIDTV